MPSLQQHAYVLGMAVVPLTLLGCGSDHGTAPPSPAAIALVSSPTVDGRAGEAVATPIVVKVTSSSGTGVPGVPVSFVSGANSGTVAQESVITDDDGTASTTWTLGTVAGVDIDTVRVSTSQLPGAPITVTASVRPAALATLAIVSGDGQPGTAGAPLAQPLVVAARDGFANPIPGVAISWTVEGGGSLSATSSVTDAHGESSVTWTLGNGDNQAHATAAGLPGTPATFHASFTHSGNVVLTAISPGTLVEGQSATLTGTGFSATLADNSVFIDGLAASITAATTTSIEITVPSFNCQPARDAGVRVVVRGDNSEVITHAVAPAAASLSLAVGQQLILRDPGSFCLQFDASSTAERYLLGVQSTSEAVSSLTPVVLTSASASTILAMAPVPRAATRAPFASGAHALDVLSTASARRRTRHRQAEGRLRVWERQHLAALVQRDALRGRAAARQHVSPLTVAADVAVGDTVQVHVPDAKGDVCSSFVPITTVARAVGVHSVWLEDVANPENGFTAADFGQLSDLMDDPIYDTDVSYFGTPQDVDGNGRIVVVISREVNRFGGILGFVTDADLVPRTDCASSNEGEFFYGVAPDSAGTLALGTYERSQAIQEAPFIIAHELSHIIQFEVRVQRGAPPMATWAAEGQATLAEEVVGHAIEGRSPGQNYGLGVAFNVDDPSSVDWYSDRFGDLATYYGFRGQGVTKAAGAPQECSWLAQHPSNPGPCIGGRDVYGVPWSLLRWLSDQFGPTYPGGEQGLQQALIDNDAIGYANIAELVGVPIDTLLAQWAAMLYVDDRVPSADPKLTLPSWNLLDIYEGTFGGVSLFPETRLVPTVRLFTAFTHAINVRGASTAYVLLDGTAGRAATAIRARTSADGQLPGIMQLFVVRIQ